MVKDTTYDERALFINISEGDETAFSMCYARYGSMLLPFLLKLVGSQDMAEEIVQEVFLKVWLHRDKLATVENPRYWLFRVAANVARNWLKRQLLAEKVMRRQQEIKIQNPVSDHMEYKAIREVVLKTIAAFPPQRKRIYQMSRDEGLKPSEIASKMNLSVSTVKNTLLSALQTIRENIEQAGYLAIFIWLLIKK